MSHLIIQPYDTVYTPAGGEFESAWHGLQTPVQGGIAVDGGNIPRVLQPILEAGFRPDFNSPLSNVPPEVAAELGENPVTDWKVLMADGRANGNGVIPIHVCKKGYRIHQNSALFAAMVAAAKAVLGEDGFEVVSCGTLGAYSQFFLSIVIKRDSALDIGGDKYTCFFNLVSSHNSLVASQNMLSLVRIVCMNTVQASIADADASGTASVIRHTLNSETLITPAKFEADLKSWLERRKSFVATLAALKATPMDLDGFRSFAAGVFTSRDSDELSTVSFNRIGEMESLFARGRGNAGVSAYDAVNSFTEYFTSGNGVGRVRGADNVAKRIASANFGRGNEWKLEAISRASTEENLADTLKRGTILYDDKLKERASVAASN